MDIIAFTLRGYINLVSAGTSEMEKLTASSVLTMTMMATIHLHVVELVLLVQKVHYQ
jgi:hypothetical protein